MEQETGGVVEAPAVDTAEPATDLATGQEVGGGSSESTSSDQLFTVKVNGEPVQVTLEEALNGYMRQEDYTRKTQEVAEQREELTYAERIAQALETDPERAIQALVSAYGVQLGQPQATAPPSEPSEDPEEAFKTRVEDFIAQQEMRAFEAQVKADFAELEQQFGTKFDQPAVIQYAVEHGIPSIREAAKAFVVDRVWSTAQRQVAEREAQARKEGAPPVAGGHGVAGGAVTPGGTVPAVDIRAALALAEQAHGITL